MNVKEKIKQQYFKDKARQYDPKDIDFFWSVDSKYVDIAILEVTKEVFDDIEKCNPMLKLQLDEHTDYQRVKKRRLSTFPKKEKELN